MIAPLHFTRAGTFDITALLLSSTFVDLELGYLLLIGQPMYHGVWHSYLFTFTVFPLAVSLIVFITERRFLSTLVNTYRFFRFIPKQVVYNFKNIYLSSLIGGVSHVFLDMWVHRVSPYLFYPSILNAENPFWLGEFQILVYVGIALLSLCTIYYWITRASYGDAFPFRKKYGNAVEIL